MFSESVRESIPHKEQLIRVEPLASVRKSLQVSVGQSLPESFLTYSSQSSIAHLHNLQQQENNPCNISFASSASISVSFENGVFKENNTSALEESFVPREARKVKFVDDELESLMKLLPLAKQRALGDKRIQASLGKIAQLLD